MNNYLIRLEPEDLQEPTFFVVYATSDFHAHEIGEVLANTTGLILVEVHDIEEAIDIMHENPIKSTGEGGGG